MIITSLVILTVTYFSGRHYRKKAINNLSENGKQEAQTTRRPIQTIQQRKRVLKWLLVIFTGTLLGAFAIFILDGFKIAGFTLPESVLNKLAWLMIAPVAGLAGIAFKFLFH